ncbi:MAG: phospho-sugar mutase [Oscillospiraceae bacterium]|nr:phospho-sugar mutase [Oscillospiraceae bacterium]
MKELKLYEEWLEYAAEDEDIVKELAEIKGNNDEIYERFYRELEFGTGGIRGILGAGLARMNIYTIRKAAAGLAVTLNLNDSARKNKDENCVRCERSVAISYDSRRKSELFAKQAAMVLAAYNIKSYIFPELMPTPALSFAVRALNCAAGIMVTASHNPAKYNGFKCYGADGCQMTDSSANEVLANINKLDIFRDVKVSGLNDALNAGWIEYIGNDVINDYYTNVKAQSVSPEIIANTDLKVVFSPLNGAGNKSVRNVLGQMGLKNLSVVKQHENPDPDFTTCPYPNPEIKEALAIPLAECETVAADLLLATDPDCDRVGTAVRLDSGEYKLLTGNEIGALLLNYICERRTENGTMPKDPIAIKTIVTTNLIKDIAKIYGVQVIDLLTGFKYIGEMIGKLEEKNEEDRYIFGVEESYGYLVGTYARDKDAVVASMLIVEMAAYYRESGVSLPQKLESLYARHGRYFHTQSNFMFEGARGMQKMSEIMNSLRASPPGSIGGLKVLSREDYLIQRRIGIDSPNEEKLTLPKSDVLVYKLENNCEVAVRPSGTEPKIKAYYTAIAPSLKEAEKVEGRMKESFSKIVLA